MLSCQSIYEAFRECGIGFYTGVPDSLLKDFCFFVSDHAPHDQHVIAANEGTAVGIAAGFHLATGRMAAVYMQNSGQGNTINPLTSLVDQEVYSIPMLLIIGWRGEPGRHDEPQHVKQGKITLSLLETLGIDYKILPESLDEAMSTIKSAVTTSLNKSAPYAIVVRKGTFEPYSSQYKPVEVSKLSREEAIQCLVDQLEPDDVVVPTTGKTARELYEYRIASGQPPGHDFLTVGSMGHASQIALGIALSKPQRQVYCLDGDGALIMHMGGMATIGSRSPKNFKHVVVNNGAHESVGGQPTAGLDINIPAVASACGYKFACTVSSMEGLRSRVGDLKSLNGPALLEIRVRCGSRAGLGRPKTSPIENKRAFEEFLRS